MLNALKEIIDGAHGALAILVLLVAMVFVLAGKMTAGEWVDLSKWVLGIFSVTHGAMTIGEAHKRRRAELPTARIHEPQAPPTAT